jgi:hypothetical protein
VGNLSFFGFKRSGVTAYLQGGLGNQLFIIAAGWQQARRLGCPLTVETSFYKKQSLRVVEVHKLGLPFQATLKESSALITSFQELVAKYYPRLGRIYKERAFTFENSIDKIKKGTEIRGYFQSQKYFSNVVADMAKSLTNAKTSQLDEDLLSKYQIDSFVAIHVRRGDYVTNPDATAVHGVTSREYFERALELLRKDTPKPVLVFTDSPDEVSQELEGIPGLIFDESLNQMSDFGTLKLFAQSQGIAISNSTFSWWGAWLLQQRNSAAKVVYPTPWFSAEIDYVDLIPANWIALPR